MRSWHKRHIHIFLQKIDTSVTDGQYKTLKANWMKKSKIKNLDRHFLFKSWWFDILLLFQFGLFCMRRSNKFLIIFLVHNDHVFKQIFLYKDQQIMMSLRFPLKWKVGYHMFVGFFKLCYKRIFYHFVLWLLILFMLI